MPKYILVDDSRLSILRGGVLRLVHLADEAWDVRAKKGRPTWINSLPIRSLFLMLACSFGETDIQEKDEKQSKQKRTKPSTEWKRQSQIEAKNNRVVHRDYLKVTKEHVATLQELLQEARALKPLDENIGHALKFAERIQEMLVYVSASCPLTQRRVSSTNASGSKPRSNTKNDRIWQPSSKSMKNKVEAHHRKFRSSANKNNYVSDCNANIKNIVEIVLWYLDSECSKHMTGHRDKLINFVSKFIGTVQFGNNYFAAIIGYRDLQMGNILISRVYYVEGLGHNLFSIGQFCDSDLKVAFRKHTCFVRYLEGVDLLSRSRGSNLYTISMGDMMKSSLICLLSKASKRKSWLWHRRLSHLNFGTIIKLVKQGLVKGLPKLKYTKDHLCSACQMGKSKKESTHIRLNLVQMRNFKCCIWIYIDRCG
ncbi:retrovirus-related pol polyprotein from transposon TNT 1-94 [Tanacetum coccineum]